MLGLAGPNHDRDWTQLLIVSTGTELMGLLVDQILRFQDLFLKELHPMLATIPAIGGASVLGDGRPVLVLDAQGLTTFSRAGDEVATPAGPT
jgi:chemotaxis protein histidine kinase CheA